MFRGFFQPPFDIVGEHAQHVPVLVARLLPVGVIIGHLAPGFGIVFEKLITLAAAQRLRFLVERHRAFDDLDDLFRRKPAAGAGEFDKPVELFQTPFFLNIHR